MLPQIHIYIPAQDEDLFSTRLSMQNNQTWSLLKTSLHKHTPEYPSPALLFQHFPCTVRKYNSEKHHSQEQRTLKLFLHISSCSQILLVSSCPTQGCHHTPTQELQDKFSHHIQYVNITQQKALGETTAAHAAVLYFPSENLSVLCLNGHRT